MKGLESEWKKTAQPFTKRSIAEAQVSVQEDVHIKGIPNFHGQGFPLGRVSISVTALTLILPRPVLHASSTPRCPSISPLVGKFVELTIRRTVDYKGEKDCSVWLKGPLEEDGIRMFSFSSLRCSSDNPLREKRTLLMTMKGSSTWKKKEEKRREEGKKVNVFEEKQ